MATTAALKKIASEVEKVAKGVENASRKGKKAKQGEEDLDTKALTGLVVNLKNALEQLVAFVYFFTCGEAIRSNSSPANSRD